MTGGPVDIIDSNVLIKRRLVWDSVNHEDVPDVIRRCGLLPGSAGGDALEHYQSHVRLAALEPVEIVVNTFSRLAGEVVYRATLDDQDPPDPDDEEHYRDIVMYAAEAIIANLIDADILHVNEGLL